MTLKEAIDKIDKTNPKNEDSPSWGELFYEVFKTHDSFWSDDTRLKSYWVKVWYCTDSYVGIKAYFLDEELVCISDKVARKDSEDFEFVSKETFKKVKEYLKSLIQETEEEDCICLIDFEQEMGENYTVSYNTQILHKNALYKGEIVEIIKTYFGFNTPDYFHSVEIKYQGEIIKVNVNELYFPYGNLI